MQTHIFTRFVHYCLYKVHGLHAEKGRGDGFYVKELTLRRLSTASVLPPF